MEKIKIGIIGGNNTYNNLSAEIKGLFLQHHIVYILDNIIGEELLRFKEDNSIDMIANGFKMPELESELIFELTCPKYEHEPYLYLHDDNKPKVYPKTSYKRKLKKNRKR
jgi:hypothetical protein